jgi:hypothetical protein
MLRFLHYNIAKKLLGTLLFLFMLGSLQAQYDTVIEEGDVEVVPYEQDQYEGSTQIDEFDPVTEKQQVSVRKLPDSLVQTLKNDEDFWYANMAPERKKEKKEESGGGFLSSGWVQDVLLVIIVVGFVGVLIWYLASINIRVFGNKTKPEPEDEEEGIGEDIFAIDYDSEIAKAVTAGNYRLAIRLQYLRTLRNLADMERINFTQEKTNS